MQHDLNKQHLDNYPFFNNELHTPDFLRLSKSELPKNVIFEVTGSKEVLGEQQRAQKFVTAVQLSSSIEQLSQQTNWGEVSQEVWMFAGTKDPERFITAADDEQSALMEQFQQVIQELQGQMQELVQEKQIDEIDKEELGADIKALENEIQVLEEKGQAVVQIVSMQRRLDDTRHRIELLLKDVKNAKSQE